MTATGSESIGDVSSARCVLFAYHEMGYACMQELLALGVPIAALFTHCDSSNEEIWWRSCSELAHHNSIPVNVVERFDEDWTARVAAMRPTVLYSFFYRSLLPDDLLKIAPLGSFNLHPSLLPKYRGRSPVNWMIINGEHEAGVTLHHMVARADAGDIVAQRAVQITEHDTAQTLCRKLIPLGAGLVREYHPLIVAGRAPRRPQNLHAGSYFGGRRPQDGRIDWNWPAQRICNLVRGVTHPYPGAFCFINGHKLMVWNARVAHASGLRGESGQIIWRGVGESVEVAAGDGSVLILSAQLDGGVEGNPAAILQKFDSAGVLHLD
jgi:methionyl-tRNA formyltransferase